MSEYETDMIKLIKQIAEDIRWLRRRAEERDRLQKEDDQELLKRIEQTHRGSSVFYAGGSLRPYSSISRISDLIKNVRSRHEFLVDRLG
jgi:hypothetical protein